MSGTGYTPVDECFTCAALIFSFSEHWVMATPFGLVRVCRHHAQKNGLARLAKPGDVIVDNKTIAGWKRGKN